MLSNWRGVCCATGRLLLPTGTLRCCMASSSAPCQPCPRAHTLLHSMQALTFTKLSQAISLDSLGRLYPLLLNMTAS